MPIRASSLRFKLVLWFVSVFFLIQATLIGGFVYLRREVVRRSLDDSLTASAEAMVDNLLAAEVEWTEDEVRGLVPLETEFVLYAVRDEVGDALLSWNVADLERLPFSAWEVVPAGPVGGVHTTIRPERAERITGNSQRLRLVTLPFRFEGRLFYFQAAVRDPVLERLLGPFFDLVAVGIPIGVLAASIAAWIIAGRAVAPMGVLSRAARKVSPTRLKERFNVATTDEEVARLEVELNSALERIEAGYKAQDQFISNVAHELKTPIAVLLAQAQVAQMGHRTLEKGYEFVNRTEAAMKHLGKVVESFLLLARSDLARVGPAETVSIMDVVLGCVHNYKLLAERSDVRLVPNLVEPAEVGPGPEVDGDGDLLLAMLENLVLNAIGHSPRGGQVAIDASCSDDSVRLEVRDQGPGIPDADLERIFGRFVRITRGEHDAGGTGLGLAIARSIAKFHSGEIRARNNPGGGCSFLVTLPRSSSERP